MQVEEYSHVALGAYLYSIEDHFAAVCAISVCCSEHSTSNDIVLLIMKGGLILTSSALTWNVQNNYKCAAFSACSAPIYKALG